LSEFDNKTGKFAIPGYPHKLGLLLHGPPGTGKTSLIKALAHHTGRHIVSVPLQRVRTNQELMNMMFDQELFVEGAGWVDVRHKQVHFCSGVSLRACNAAPALRCSQPASRCCAMPQACHRAACESAVRALVHAACRHC
jgi:ATPase family associated with various cellular activities (AAA)